MRGVIGLAALAWRNFSRNLNRYRVLLAALTLVVACLVLILGTVMGMSESLRGKASRYFAGDVVVLGYDGSGRSLITDPEAVREALDEAIERSGIPVVTRSERSTYYEATNAMLFFAGYYARQRRLVGVEWERERPILSTFDFVEGAVPSDGDREGILISTAIADALGARVGDEILVSVVTERGRSNTVDLFVRGIFAESSFFGYTSYLERWALNRVLELPEERVNEIGLYLADPLQDERRAARAITAALAERVPTFPVLRDRDMYSQAARERRDERAYGVVTLEAQLEEITDLLNAIILIAGVVIVLFLGIVVIGVSNTYAMIVFERTREIGTLRALGMQRGRTIVLFLLESLYLGLSGVILGVLTGTVVLEILRRTMVFGGPGWATLFLVQGRIQWSLPAVGIAAISALALAASFVGCLRAAVRAGFIRPVDALRHE